MTHTVATLLPLLMAMLLPALAATSCSSPAATADAELTALYTDTIYRPTHAAGFTITAATDGSTLLTVANPWQGADSTRRHLQILAPGAKAVPFIPAISGPAARLVCMSSTHVALLEAADALPAVVGVSGMQFITNPAIRAGADTIADVGYDSGIDYERILALRPDLVLIYGVNSSSPMEAKLAEIGIPCIYVGEYLETTPLGRAEWMVALGHIAGHRAEAVERFRKIVPVYDSIAALARADSTVTAMLNTPYGDAWFMPPTGSYMPNLITDAGGRPAYTVDHTRESTPIDLEQAAMLLSRADVWLTGNDFRSLQQLHAAVPKAPFQGRAYGVVPDFWEGGVSRPHMVLGQLHAILHNPDTTTRYFHLLR